MSYNNPRINSLSMSPLDIVKEMADDNPGAITVMLKIIQKGQDIDPDDVLAPYGALFALDTLDCYGSRIWMLYKDVCGENINATIGVLRANQLGFVPSKVLHAAINGTHKLDVQHLLKQVKDRLPAFKTEN